MSKFCLVSVLNQGTQKEKVFLLKEGNNFVGSSPRADIKLDTKIAKFLHCVIKVNGSDTVSLKPTHPGNQIFLNSVRLDNSGTWVSFKVGDIVGFGLKEDYPSTEFPVVYNLSKTSQSDDLYEAAFKMKTRGKAPRTKASEHYEWGPNYKIPQSNGTVIRQPSSWINPSVEDIHQWLNFIPRRFPDPSAHNRPETSTQRRSPVYSATFRCLSSCNIALDEHAKSSTDGLMPLKTKQRGLAVQDPGSNTDLTFSGNKGSTECSEQRIPITLFHRALKNVIKPLSFHSVVEQNEHNQQMPKIALNPGRFIGKPKTNSTVNQYSRMLLIAIQRVTVRGTSETALGMDNSTIQGSFQSPEGKKILPCSASNTTNDQLFLRVNLPDGKTYYCPKYAREFVIKQPTFDFKTDVEVNLNSSCTVLLQAKVAVGRRKEAYLKTKFSRGAESKLEIEDQESKLGILNSRREIRHSERQSSSDSDQLVHEEEKDITCQAVVAKTLTSSSNETISAFECGSEFGRAVDDEASQSVEAENRRSLNHSAKHSLPVVNPHRLSSIGRDNGFNIRLFDHLFTACGTIPRDPLNRQFERYRMYAEEIAAFPSRRFYSNRLFARFSRQPLVIKLYNLINHNFKEDYGGEMNPRELKSVIKNTELFLKRTELSFDGIFRYERQCRYADGQSRLLRPIQNQQKPVNGSKIGAHQVQERETQSDCASFLSDWLNVTLTQARQSLIICSKLNFFA